MSISYPLLGAARRAPVAGPAVAALAALALHAACGGRYGIFRDELYFVVCGERLAWGYVDQPPGIAVVARVAHALFGTWVPGLRLLPWLATVAAVFIAGRLAFRFGGGGFAALLAGLAVAVSPTLAGLGHYLTMNAFEVFLATALALVLVRLADGDDPRLWLLAGALAAAGVLMKYTFALLVIAFLVGFVATGARRALWSRWAVSGAALGIAAVVPNLLWQMRNGLPFLEVVRRGQESKNVALSSGQFLATVAFEAGPVTALLAIAGLVSLLVAWRAVHARFLGIGAALYLVVLLAMHGKPYYFAPAIPALVAAGACAAESALRAAFSRSAAAAITIAAGLALVPLALPILPLERLPAYLAAIRVRPQALERHRYGVLPQILADQFGWPELARSVADVVRSLPEEERARAVVYGQNYGEAAAIDVYGPALGLPPAVSGHNQYFLWGVPNERGDPSIIIGDEGEDCGHGAFRTRTLAARMPENPWAMPYESGRLIWICRGLTVPTAQLWPTTKSYR